MIELRYDMGRLDLSHRIMGMVVNFFKRCVTWRKSYTSYRNVALPA